MIANYNAELERLCAAHPNLSSSELKELIDDFIDTDPTKISWTRALNHTLSQRRAIEFDPSCLYAGIYRPFMKSAMYFSRELNEMVYQMPRIFPTAQAQNLVIQASGLGAKSFSVLISDQVPCLDNIEKGQCFPLYLYEEAASVDEASPDLFAAEVSVSGLVRRPAITEAGLKHFTEFYAGDKLDREDIFYYIYGLLHSSEYRACFGDNLSKELPRIPRVKTAAGFWGFSKAGRSLAALHLGFESVEKYPASVETRGKVEKPADYYRVTKMRHPKTKDEDGNSVNDLTTVIYNERITVSGIPLEAYEYMVNGKSAIGWVMDRQKVKTDKASGIVNDANDWAVDTMNNPKYPLELLLRVITVSVETVRIVKALPDLEID